MPLEFRQLIDMDAAAARAVAEPIRLNEPFHLDPVDAGARPVFVPRGRKIVVAKLDQGGGPPLTDKLMNTLLSSVKEILEVDGEVAGSCLTERIAGAKGARYPVYVRVAIPAIKDIAEQDKLFNLVEQLGWGKCKVTTSDDAWLTLQFAVQDRPVHLVFNNEPVPFDDYVLSINKVRYTLDKGLEIDPDAQESLDTGVIRAYKKITEKRELSINTQMIPYFSELTNRKFVLKKKGK